MDLNGYRIMWLFVFFDLPTETKKDKKNASGFRNNLLKDGFSMIVLVERVLMFTKNASIDYCRL